MIDFTCVYFGHDSNTPDKWWNINAKGFATAEDAAEHGKFMMPTPGTFGFAVIRELEDEWEILDDLSILPPNCSIGCNRLGTFSIQPAPQLHLV